MIKKEMIIRNLNEISPVQTMHGNGEKRVLVSNEETNTMITQIAVTTLKKGENVELHSHPTMEEHFIFLEGECEAIIGGQNVYLKAGAFIKVPAATEHLLCPITDIRMITIGIATE